MNEFINFAFGADVDSSGRFIKNQYLAVADQPFGDDDFLLVAT